MDQQASLAVSVMLNSFRQTSADPDVLIRTFGSVLDGQSPAIIIETAKRYSSGEVEGASDQFAPTPAEFAKEVRRRAELKADIGRQRSLPAPRYFPGPLAPFQIRQEKRRAENADRPVIEAHAPLDRFIALSRSKQLPVGAIWVACMGILGPKPKQQPVAAE
ncbi:hypothetical protein EN866_34855 [Mesorhizobium sp. M2D.F.Ca.ET.223.01.1.1]|uniref:hypothetical protein n=1 Tax=Mesorhizobium sp. M2D.F.Ca.ET.223.01.1.1 TaxID=2563940 RepID=UPI0010923541|nr:hypothetical protein [Mesorhizobium sp. M2D.F.Ca.ET.223.01.1.1]TGR82327.1 hypothetical protein EN866_34855 [Mesorhizobium sp. M2D.F.Ca.ET.223.01.1.1]TGT64482.1 hypothetical protein EN802_32355 [bacterium M00.F.Ca.ET.159.01.1.1]TGT79327.1 hypothetical protein EN800_31695 [bacterium M00.F.Ca.ET.157.01.1.1]